MLAKKTFVEILISFLVNSDKRAAQDNKSRITLLRKGKVKLGSNVRGVWPPRNLWTKR